MKDYPFHANIIGIPLPVAHPCAVVFSSTAASDRLQMKLIIKFTLDPQRPFVAEVDFSLHIAIVGDVKLTRPLRGSKKEPSFFAIGVTVRKQLIHVRPQQKFFALQLLAVTLALQKSLHVDIAQFTRKLDEAVVLALARSSAFR